MALISQRLHEVDAWGGQGEALPPAEGLVFQITKSAQEQSSGEKKTLQLVLDLVVVSEGELKGRKAFQRYQIGADAKEPARMRLKALILATRIQMNAAGEFDDTQLVGAYFMADSIATTYDSHDAVSGQTVTKKSAKIVNERVPVAAAPAQAPQFAPAAPVAPQYAAPPAAPQYAAPAAPQFAAAPQYAAPVAAPQYAPQPAPAFGPPSVPAGAYGGPVLTPVGR